MWPEIKIFKSFPDNSDILPRERTTALRVWPGQWISSVSVPSQSQVNWGLVPGQIRLAVDCDASHRPASSSSASCRCNAVSLPWFLSGSPSSGNQTLTWSEQLGVQLHGYMHSFSSFPFLFMLCFALYLPWLKILWISQQHKTNETRTFASQST